jgi:hypothetical protein
MGGSVFDGGFEKKKASTGIIKEEKALWFTWLNML